MRRLPVVTAWIGNTPSVAIGHYLQTLESDFNKPVKGGAESGARAAQIQAQIVVNLTGREKTESLEMPEINGVLSETVRRGEVLSQPARSFKYTKKYSNLQPSVP